MIDSDHFLKLEGHLWNMESKGLECGKIIHPILKGLCLVFQNCSGVELPWADYVDSNLITDLEDFHNQPRFAHSWVDFFHGI